MLSILVISLALALGTYGLAAQRGANLVKLDKYTVLMSALWGILELAAALIGYGAGRWILAGEIGAAVSGIGAAAAGGAAAGGIGITAGHGIGTAAVAGIGAGGAGADILAAAHSPFWIHVLAGLLLASVGLRMILHALKKKTFLEHRIERIDIREDVLLSMRLCVHALFLGVACGLLGLSLSGVLVSVFVLTAAFAGIGYVSGRANGALFTDQAIGAGGGILCALGILLQVM